MMQPYCAYDLPMCLTPAQETVSACSETMPAIAPFSGCASISAGTQGGSVFVVTAGQEAVSLSSALTSISDPICIDDLGSPVAFVVVAGTAALHIDGSPIGDHICFSGINNGTGTPDSNRNLVAILRRRMRLRIAFGISGCDSGTFSRYGAGARGSVNLSSTYILISPAYH